MRLLLLSLASLGLLTACQTERTVLAGPQQTSLEINDYNPEQEAQSAEIGRKAAASGMVGSQFGGGSGWSQRFGNADPHGYMSKDPKTGKPREGLNAMSEKMFGGDTSTRNMKSFTQTKDFLTKRYGNTKELDQKESASQRISSWLSGKKARTDKLALETDQNYRDSNRVLANKTNRNDGRTIAERLSRDDGRSAATRDFYPAKKALENGSDKPRILGDADRATANAVTNLIRSRPRDNPATVEDIRKFLGKGD